MKYQCECGSTVMISESVYRLREILFCSNCRKETNWTPIEWPDVQTDTEILFNGDTYWKTPDMGKCFECGENLTQWVSLSFEGYICSPDCAERAWQNFFGVN